MADGLKAQALSFARADKVLFARLNFHVRLGEALQITGPNGSGKTTLLHIICGLLLPSAGSLHWQNRPILKQRTDYYANLLYVGHQPPVKQDLTVIENLAFLTSLAQQCQDCSLQAALQSVDLAAHQHTIARHLSAGQQRRLALARLLIAQAPLWILDEPFTALDKSGITWLETCLQQHLVAGGMVIFTSHQAITLATVALQKIVLQEIAT